VNPNLQGCIEKPGHFHRVSKKVPHISQGSVMSYKDMMGLLILLQITAECYCERILNVSLHFGEVTGQCIMPLFDTMTSGLFFNHSLL